MEAFKTFLCNIKSDLNQFGFKKSGSYFYKDEKEVIVVIHFQKSQRSNKSLVSFTINLGIYSKGIPEVYSITPLKFPKIYDCHFTIRSGQLLGLNEDKWWHLESSSMYLSQQESVLSFIFCTGIPFLEKFNSENKLILHWESGFSYGVGNLDRLLNLTALLSKNNRVELEKYVNELILFSKGKTFEIRVINHLKNLQLPTSID